MRLYKILFVNKVLHLQHWAEKGKKKERERKITYKKHYISIEQP